MGERKTTKEREEERRKRGKEKCVGLFHVSMHTRNWTLVLEADRGHPPISSAC